MVPKIPLKLQEVPIRDVIIANTVNTKDFFFLTLNTTVQDLLDFIETYDRVTKRETSIESGACSEIPVLESTDNKFVVGAVKVCKLRSIAQSCTSDATPSSTKVLLVS